MFQCLIFSSYFRGLVHIFLDMEGDDPDDPHRGQKEEPYFRGFFFCHFVFFINVSYV